VPDACELTILMPCLNEAATVGACVDVAAAALRASDTTGEVIVADNGSTDGSREITTAHGSCRSSCGDTARRSSPGSPPRVAAS
jgi:glycosyltransferase involved in cell wall biosynthesis